MKLLRLQAINYRSLRDTRVTLSDMNLFIGANGSGKSAILDALRFLQEGVQGYDFRGPAYSRGGIVHLAWKGEEARQVELSLLFEDNECEYGWSVRLVREGHEFRVEERINMLLPNSPPVELLNANGGRGWWWSDDRRERVSIRLNQTACALAVASADESFRARALMDFISSWGFFDPNPFLLRRDWTGLDSGSFDPYGRNLAETLYGIWKDSPDTLELICASTRSVLGIPSRIEPRESDDRFYFVQYEPDLEFPVNQMGVSSGTLRMIALMTAVHGSVDSNLLGIEEPENYIHPTALFSFVEHLQAAQSHIQFLITTHSPMLLDFLGEPEAVRLVGRSGNGGTSVSTEENADGVRRALVESGFGLGEFYETKGFGS